MTAGMRHETLAIAVSALRQHHGTLRSATLLHGGQRLALAGQNPALVRRQKFGLEGLNDSGEQDHLTFPQSRAKPFIKALITWLAFCFVPSVRWV